MATQVSNSTANDPNERTKVVTTLASNNQTTQSTSRPSVGQVWPRVKA